MLLHWHAHPQFLPAKFGTDIAQCLHFLVLKSRILVASGHPSKAFSIALRASSTAERHRLIRILMEGLTDLSTILNDLSEFKAAQDLAEAALPFVSLDEVRTIGSNHVSWLKRGHFLV